MAVRWREAVEQKHWGRDEALQKTSEAEIRPSESGRGLNWMPKLPGKGAELPYGVIG